jgi:hypothetical protein
LDERYGWVPSEIKMQQGVLRSKEEKVNAYFYFRSPQMETPEEFTEKPGSHDAKMLADLKDVLRSQKEYPIQNYDSIENLGDLVERDFKALVDMLFPQGALSELETERFEQRNFLKSRTGVYVPTPAYFEALDAFVQSDERALVVSGENGMGKSALLANWIQHRQRPAGQRGETILYHFIGNSRSEGDYRKITGRLINEIKDLYGIQSDKDNEKAAEVASTNTDKQKES